ncbi:MAG: redox-regulated ATPase YchF [Patescibacteria group bacterium]
MMLSIGIVGLPNVGKSTLFQALTKKQVGISNYPFTTIDPNIGVVAVPDERLELLAKMSKSKKIVPTAVEFIDIAGLVKGAAQGEGLGNKFLANIREVDAIVHIIRVFENENIVHIHKRIDPVEDIEIIETELALADLESKEKRAARKDTKDLPPLQLLMDKKVIYVFNVSETQLRSHWQPDERLLAAIKGADYVVLSNTFELALSEVPPEEQAILLEEVGLKESGLDELIRKCYHTLDLITFLTTGEDETRAWTAKRDTPIPVAARAIHTDFEKLFIRAEVINWQELLSCGGWSAARTAGKLKLVGRDYIVQDGDVVEIKI